MEWLNTYLQFDRGPQRGGLYSPDGRADGFGELDQLRAIVIDNEIIGMIYRILAGIEVNDETLGFDVIESVGPGGNYVAEDHTVEHMMDEFFYPDLSVRCNFDIWEEQGRPDMLSRARDLVRKILREGQKGLLDHDLIADIKQAFPDSQSF
ncbi:trimethylamine methyltransferase family protein [Dehalococcoidia bacterium]|nr:trimethylamine methyltransferase family protein [Dehalococcoidia bacterium]